MNCLSTEDNNLVRANLLISATMIRFS